MALHRLGGVCDTFDGFWAWVAAVVVQTIRLDNIICYY